MIINVRKVFFPYYRNHNVSLKCAVYDNLSVHSSSSSSRESSSRRWLSERSGTRVVVRKLWHLTMRASRTGVINLKPIGGWREWGGGGKRGRTIPTPSPRGWWWQITWTRAASESRTQLVHGLLGTLGKCSWCTIAVCTIRRPMTNPANGTSARRIMREQNKLYGCSDFHGRDTADGRRIGYARREIGETILLVRFQNQISAR